MTTYATDHGFTPPTGPFGGGDGCRVMLARYACPYGQDEHDPTKPPEDLDVFGYRRHPRATDPGQSIAGPSAAECSRAGCCWPATHTVDTNQPPYAGPALVCAEHMGAAVASLRHGEGLRIARLATPDAKETAS